MTPPNKKDKIEVYKDKELLNLTAGVYPALDSEEITLVMFNAESDEKGRTIRDIRIDKISTLKAINKILESRYKNNSVAESYMAVNSFMINVLKEQLD